jgi:hypothetical protein
MGHDPFDSTICVFVSIEKEDQLHACQLIKDTISKRLRNKKSVPVNGLQTLSCPKGYVLLARPLSLIHILVRESET